MLSAEPLIVSRLQSVLGASAQVFTAPDLAGVAEAKQVTPAVHVVYGGYRVTQEQGEGLIVELEQDWYTVVVVRNVRDIRSGAAAREDAGPLLARVFRGLTGHRLAPGWRRLRPTQPPRAGYSKGYGYYPLSWSLRLQLRGEQ